MSEADKMFEELGYELLDEFDRDYNDKYIAYIKAGKTIIFKKSNKKVGIKDCQRNYINIQELKAINKKVEELGWNE